MSDDRGAITLERIEKMRERITRRRILGYRDVPVKITQMERLLELANAALNSGLLRERIVKADGSLGEYTGKVLVREIGKK